MLQLKSTRQVQTIKEPLSKRENMLRQNYRTLVISITAALVISCVIPALVPESVPAVATFDPNSINTVIALTSAAAATQTAQMSPPTLTPTVTLIPANLYTPTETPTPTFIFLLPTATVPPTQIPPGSSGLEYECQVISQSPPIDSVMPKGTPFEAHWKVANVGTVEWDPNNADYRYVSGDQLHTTSAFDLSEPVSPGGTIDFTVEMQAPSDPGSYSTLWKINVGKTKFCSMRITIVVN